MNLSGVMQLPRLFKRAGVVESGRAIPYAQREPVLEECHYFLAYVRDRLEPMGSGEVAAAAVRALEALSKSLRPGGRIVPV